QQEIHRIAMLIDGSVQIAPFAADLDIGLINPYRAAMGSTKLPQPFLADRCISQYPAVDHAMINLEAPLAKHLFQVRIAERVAQSPGNSLYNQPVLSMPALEMTASHAKQPCCAHFSPWALLPLSSAC